MESCFQSDLNAEAETAADPFSLSWIDSKD